MYTGHRDLVLCKVVDVRKSTSVTYRACTDCCTKLLCDPDIQRWVCLKCGQKYPPDRVMYRYRVTLSITDGSAICNTTVFGKNMDPYLGATAQDFFNFMESLKKPTDTMETILMESLTAVFMGKMFYFGFRTGSRNSKHTGNPVTLKDMNNNKTKGTGSATSLTSEGLVAFQIFSANPETKENTSTVLQSLKNFLRLDHDESPHRSLLQTSTQNTSAYHFDIVCHQYGCTYDNNNQSVLHKCPQDNSSCAFDQSKHSSTSTSDNQSSLALSCDSALSEKLGINTSTDSSRTQLSSSQHISLADLTGRSFDISRVTGASNKPVVTSMNASRACNTSCPKSPPVTINIQDGSVHRTCDSGPSVNNVDDLILDNNSNAIDLDETVDPVLRASESQGEISIEQLRVSSTVNNSAHKVALGFSVLNGIDFEDTLNIPCDKTNRSCLMEADVAEKSRVLNLSDCSLGDSFDYEADSSSVLVPLQNLPSDAVVTGNVSDCSHSDGDGTGANIQDIECLSSLQNLAVDVLFSPHASDRYENNRHWNPPQTDVLHHNASRGNHSETTALDINFSATLDNGNEITDSDDQNMWSDLPESEDLDQFLRKLATDDKEGEDLEKKAEKNMPDAANPPQLLPCVNIEQRTEPGGPCPDSNTKLSDNLTTTRCIDTYDIGKERSRDEEDLWLDDAPFSEGLDDFIADLEIHSVIPVNGGTSDTMSPGTLCKLRGREGPDCQTSPVIHEHSELSEKAHSDDCSAYCQIDTDDIVSKEKKPTCMTTLNGTSDISLHTLPCRSPDGHDNKVDKAHTLQCAIMVSENRFPASTHESLQPTDTDRCLDSDVPIISQWDSLSNVDDPGAENMSAEIPYHSSLIASIQENLHHEHVTPEARSVFSVSYTSNDGSCDLFDQSQDLYDDTYKEFSALSLTTDTSRHHLLHTNVHLASDIKYSGPADKDPKRKSVHFPSSSKLTASENISSIDRQMEINNFVPNCTLQRVPEKSCLRMSESFSHPGRGDTTPSMDPENASHGSKRTIADLFTVRETPVQNTLHDSAKKTVSSDAKFCSKLDDSGLNSKEKNNSHLQKRSELVSSEINFSSPKFPTSLKGNGSSADLIATDSFIIGSQDLFGESSDQSDSSCLDLVNPDHSDSSCLDLVQSDSSCLDLVDPDQSDSSCLDLVDPDQSDSSCLDLANPDQERVMTFESTPLAAERHTWTTPDRPCRSETTLKHKSLPDTSTNSLHSPGREAHLCLSSLLFSSDDLFSDDDGSVMENDSFCEHLSKTSSNFSLSEVQDCISAVSEYSCLGNSQDLFDD